MIAYQPRLTFRLEQDGFIYVDFDGEVKVRVAVSWVSEGMAWDLRAKLLAVHPLLSVSELVRVDEAFAEWLSHNKLAVANQWRRKEAHETRRSKRVS